MEPRGFRKATVDFTEPLVIGDDVLDEDLGPINVQLEGPWIHLTKDYSGPLATVWTVPASSIRGITWLWPMVPPRGQEPSES